MAQLSSNLLTYEQLLIKVNKLILLLNQKTGLTKEEVAQQYAALITDVKEQMGSVLTKYDPFIKGEPPISSKMNLFFRDAAQDLSALARQIDLINAKTVNIFNLFNKEIENEKKFSERIVSKAKVLQMYSKSPADDLIYVGDSFENDDLIDYTKITKGMNPLIKNGILSLAVVSSEKMAVSGIKILNSNGFIGNNHEVVKMINSEGTDIYEFVFENSESLNNLNTVRDSNPLTYFECEALNVDKTSAIPVQSIPASDNEFKYIKSSNSSSNINESNLIDWSNHPEKDALELKLELSTKYPQKNNSIDIVPYFGSSRLIEVIEVIVYNKNGSSENILKKPIFIGTSIIPVNIENAKTYYYNKATVRFSEREIIKIEILFKQSQSSDIQIQHIYWKPTENNVGNPFMDLERFNPDILNRDVYEVVEYDKYAVIPKISNPIEFKKSGEIYKGVDVSLQKKPVLKSIYVIEVSIETASATIEKIYFQGWFSESGRDENNDPIVIKTAQFINSVILEEDGLQTKNYLSKDDAKKDYEELVSKYQGVAVDAIDDITYGGVISKIEIITKNINTTERLKKYRVNVKSQRELYSAKRWSIGLRDIEVYSEAFANELEIVSLPFSFDLPVESLMLSVDSDINNEMLKNCTIQSYISVDGGSQWIEISPIQLDFNGIPEVIYFNQSILNEYKLSGASYFTYPQVPKEVRTVIVKIKVKKVSSKNFTPNIYSYQLVAKVKRS